MKIKVCGMREADNIQNLCQLPIDYIGFIFYEKSPRYADKILTPEIARSIPNHIKKTGVFVNETLETILKLAQKYNLSAIQLHGNETPDFCATIKSHGFEIIKAFGIDEKFKFETLTPYTADCEYFLFDTKSSKHGGTGEKFDWNILKEYNNNKPIFLSGGITSKDEAVINHLSWLNIYCLDLNSKFEIAPAVKDIELLKAFIDKTKSNN